jgi:hypothetical protein
MNNLMAIVKGNVTDVTNDVIELDTSSPTSLMIADTLQRRQKAARALLKSGKKPFYLLGVTEDHKFVCSSSRNYSNTKAQCYMTGKLYVFAADLLS